MPDASQRATVWLLVLVVQNTTKVLVQRAAVQDQFKRYARTWGPRAPDPGPDPDPDPSPQPGRAPLLPLTLNPDP